MKPGSRRCGFTLLELLAVFAIVALLLVIATAAYQRVTRASHATACLSNLRQIGVALSAYLGENDLVMPELKAAREKKTDDGPTIDTALAKYAPNAAIFACPADRAGLAATSGTSYFWNSALNGQATAAAHFLNLTAEQSRIPVLFDKEGFHPYLNDKVNILYMDGHATQDLKFWSESK